MAGLHTLALAGGGAPVTWLPPVQSVARPASLTALTTDPGGNPVLAWVENGPGLAADGRSYDQLRAARWTGGGWQPMGEVLNENRTHNAAQLSAVRGPDGQPWLGWSEDAGTAHVDSYLISRWDGGAWSSASQYAVRRNLSDAGKSRAFTVTALNLPYLTWTNIYYPGASADVVQPFTWQPGSRTWDEHALPLNHTIRSAAFFPAAASGPDGTVYTAWLEGDVAHSDVYVSRRGPDGLWRPVGSALNVRPHTYTFAPQLAVGAAGPVAAWMEDQGGIDNVFVKRWTGSAWQALGASLNVRPGLPAERPKLALDAGGGPVVAWAEGQPGARQVYARRWTGTRWALLGGGPLNGRGHDAFSASVTVDGQGRAVVAWCEGTGMNAAVKVRRFSP